MARSRSHLNPKRRYLQVALNTTLAEAREIIGQLPASDRIIIEAGTPLIKRHGIGVVADLAAAYAARLNADAVDAGEPAPTFGAVLKQAFLRGAGGPALSAESLPRPYVVADLKTMDRGATEVEMAAAAGASAVVLLGSAPIETLDQAIAACGRLGLDAMVDMMNVEFPVGVLRQLRTPPPVVILHRGVDEEVVNKQKLLPLHEIRRIKGGFDVMVAVAGGDTPREVQSAVFNDADIVVVWKSVYRPAADTVGVVAGFLKEIR